MCVPDVLDDVVARLERDGAADLLDPVQPVVVHHLRQFENNCLVHSIVQFSTTFGTVLNSRISAQQKYGAVPRRARI